MIIVTMPSLCKVKHNFNENDNLMKFLRFEGREELFLGNFLKENYFDEKRLKF